MQAPFEQLIIASHNQGKVREIAELLAPMNIAVRSASELQLEEPEENGATFAENAHIKSWASAQAAQLPALADDSGLVVPALDGAPGIYSARWAGPEKSFAKASERIQAELEERGIEPQGVEAYFVCVLSLCWPDGSEQGFEGRVYGTLTFPPRGEKGFGYDPIFIPKGHNDTFAEMPSEQKQAMSHRAEAFTKMVAWLTQRASA